MCVCNIQVKGGSPEMDLKVQRMEHQLEIEIQEAFLRWGHLPQEDLDVY